jgi:serine/threonine-protein kinase
VPESDPSHIDVCPYCRAPNPAASRRCTTCDRALFGADQIDVGFQIGAGGRYEVVRFLGRGGWGMVYKAFDRKLEEPVALKVLRHSELVGVPEKDLKRFLAEVRLARKVRHPNVCAIHEYAEDGALRYIAMEFIDGTDLRHLLREHKRLPPSMAFPVVLGAAAGLEAVHHTGVVHRDLKPDNIMIDARGVPRLMDFGIAKTFEAGGAGITATQAIVGTPWYMSPEQTRGETLDPRSDVYSFGVVIFELFTGDVPFRSEDLVEVILKHRTEPPPLTGPRAAGLPEPVVPILARALAKDPAQRYPSMQQMRLDLTSASDAMAVVAPTMVALPTEAGRSSSGSNAWTQPAAPTQTTETPVRADAPTEGRVNVPTKIAPAPAGGYRASHVAVVSTALAAIAVAATVWLVRGGATPTPSPQPIAVPSAAASPAALASPSPEARLAPTPIPSPTPRPRRSAEPVVAAASPTAPQPEATARPLPSPSPVAVAVATPLPTPVVPPTTLPAPRVVEPFPLPASDLPAGWQPPVPAPDNPQPSYRREDVAKVLKGRKVHVLMSVVVSEAGAVTQVEVHSGDEPFVKAAVDAVRRWRYTPATFRGEARPVKILIDVSVEQQR